MCISIPVLSPYLVSLQLWHSLGFFHNFYACRAEASVLFIVSSLHSIVNLGKRLVELRQQFFTVLTILSYIFCGLAGTVYQPHPLGWKEARMATFMHVFDQIWIPILTVRFGGPEDHHYILWWLVKRTRGASVRPQFHLCCPAIPMCVHPLRVGI